jgi:predicted ATPase
MGMTLQTMSWNDYNIKLSLLHHVLHQLQLTTKIMSVTCVNGVATDILDQLQLNAEILATATGVRREWNRTLLVLHGSHS